MPLYHYHCDKCGEFEEIRGIFEKPLTECPKCGGEIHQHWNPPAILWRGDFRFMKGEPEVDMDKIEAEENARELKKIKGKIHEAVKGKKHGKYW